MKRKRRRRQAASAERNAHSRVLSVVVQALVTIILVIAKLLFEQQDIGKKAEELTLGLQQRLLATVTPQPVAVTVVEIDEAVPLRIVAGTMEPTTDRRKLLDLVDALAGLDPAAIGVDVIFGNPDGRLDEEDSLFLEACLRLRNSAGEPIPVFVGIDRAIVLGSARWLGEERFGKLAASITVPHEIAQTSSMLERITLNRPGSDAISIDSLPRALATSVIGRERLESRAPWLLENRHDIRERQIDARTILVNLGAVPALRRSSLRPAQAVALSRSEALVRDRVIILGRADGEGDRFDLPVGHQVPGLYVHAAATESFLRRPLYRLTHGGRIVVDLAVTLCLFSLLRGGERALARRLTTSTAHEMLYWVMVFLLSVVVFIIGYYGSVVTAVLWTDYLVVILALLVHRPIEVFTHAGAARLAARRAARAAR